MSVKQYDVWVAYLPTSKGSHVQGGCRPVIVMSNDLANTHSPVITVVPVTSSTSKRPLPTHVAFALDGLTSASVALCEQILSVDKPLLSYRIGAIHDESVRASLNRALAVQLGMTA